MPKAMEDALKKKAQQMIASGKMKKTNQNAFIYGTMRKTGWVPKSQKV